MCGICGIVDYGENRRFDSKLELLLDRMCQNLTHRGPDDQDVEIFRTKGHGSASVPVGLGHRRLSIIDLVRGQQPMCNEDQDVWTVFNGEIYNFQSIRRRLKCAGHQFRTNCDTECLVHEYEEKAAGMVEQLRGMFAFAIWDHQKQELLLARDRLGQKPLYYLHDSKNEIFAFASEIKALTEIPGFDRTVDLGALNYYLTYQYVPYPYSMFKSVRKLPPAHTLSFDPQSGETELKQYWQPQTGAPEFSSYPDAREALRAELSEAVKLRLMSDVPLGAFLSGGIDSSITVALMNETMPGRVQTFSIGFEEKRYDESDYAKLVARHCGTDHTQKIVRPNALEILPELVWHYDEPFGDSSAIPTYYVSQLARQNVKVVLTGDAGDECFAGYPRYFAAWIGELWDRLPKPLRDLSRSSFWEKMPVSIEGKTLLRRLRRLMRGLSLPAQKRYLDWISIFDGTAREKLLNPEIRENMDLNGPEEFLNGLYGEMKQGNFVQRTTSVDLMSYLPCDLLKKVDIASMAHGLEARSPFLDYKIVELAGRIPIHWKLRPGINGMPGKYILKDAFADLLPRPVLLRRKMGFGVPLGRWFRKDLRELARDVLLSASARQRGYFIEDEVERLVEEHTQGSADHGYRLWSLLMLELWHRQFVDDGPLGL